MTSLASSSANLGSALGCLQLQLKKAVDPHGVEQKLKYLYKVLEDAPLSGPNYDPKEVQMIMDSIRVLEKSTIFVPTVNQMGNPYHDSNTGEFTSGQGGSTGGANFTINEALAAKNWINLSKDEKLERMSDMMLQAGHIANTHKNPEARNRAKERLAKWNRMSAAGNREVFEQSMGSYHEMLRAQPKVAPVTGDAVALWDKPPGKIRAAIADASIKVADLGRTVSTLFDAAIQLGGEKTAAIAGVGSVITALTVLAAGINGASRSKDVKTLVGSVQMIDGATRKLNGAIPGLKETVKGSPKAMAAINQVNAKVAAVNNSVTSVRQTVARAQFKATGGTITTKPGPNYTPIAKPGEIFRGPVKVTSPRSTSYYQAGRTPIRISQTTMTPYTYGSKYSYTTKNLVAKLQKLQTLMDAHAY